MKAVIVLISSGQPSLNPRLVKEADALCEIGYSVIVIYQYWNNWGTKFDEELLKTKKWKSIRVGGTPNSDKIDYWLSRVTFKFYSILSRKTSFKFNIAELAIGRCTTQLLKKSLKIKADLYIAHNLGALPIAVRAAKQNNAKCGFDAEDFHRNEVSNDWKSFDVKLKSYLECKYLHRLDYLTVASPLIAQAYKALDLNLTPVVINNVFELEYQPALNLNLNKGLKLFWFSQTIGKNRGLEDVILALNLINNSLIELNLLGNINESEKIYFDNLATFEIIYHQPISGKDIFKLANQFDIGLALEISSPYNRSICLTNKLFTYLLSGLAIIASNTQAQTQFMEENLSVGELYPIGNINYFADVISAFYKNKRLLNSYKKNAYHLARTKYNWELEQKKFTSLIHNTLNEK